MQSRHRRSIYASPLPYTNCSTLELGLCEHSSNPVLAPTYDPGVLARANSLAKDITFLLGLLPQSVTSTAPSDPLPAGPLPPFALPAFLAPIFSDPPAPLTTYLDHLNELSASEATAPGLLAHAYVRYLGDLSGGQFIMAKVRKAYKLDGLDGVRFYHFDLQGGEEGDEESRAEGKRRAGEVKDWFRKGMDEGTGDDEALKGEYGVFKRRVWLIYSYTRTRGQPCICSQHIPLLDHPHQATWTQHPQIPPRWKTVAVLRAKGARA